MTRRRGETMAGTMQRAKAIALFERWTNERGANVVPSWQNFQLWCKGQKIEPPAKRMFRDWKQT